MIPIVLSKPEVAAIWSVTLISIYIIARRRGSLVFPIIMPELDLVRRKRLFLSKLMKIRPLLELTGVVLLILVASGVYVPSNVVLQRGSGAVIVVSDGQHHDLFTKVMDHMDRIRSSNVVLIGIDGEREDIRGDAPSALGRTVLNLLHDRSIDRIIGLFRGWVSLVLVIDGTKDVNIPQTKFSGVVVLHPETVRYTYLYSVYPNAIYTSDPDEAGEIALKMLYNPSSTVILPGLGVYTIAPWDILLAISSLLLFFSYTINRIFQAEDDIRRPEVMEFMFIPLLMTSYLMLAAATVFIGIWAEGRVKSVIEFYEDARSFGWIRTAFRSALFLVMAMSEFMPGHLIMIANAALVVYAAEVVVEKILMRMV